MESGKTGPLVVPIGLVLLIASGPCLAAGYGEKPEGEEPYGRTPKEVLPYGKWDAPPYRRLFKTAPTYRGPGREEPEPRGLRSVKLGLFTPMQGPGDDADSGRATADGVTLALEEANASGGYKGLPFELVARNDQLLWGASSKVAVDLAYKEEVWAILGSLDSDTTHVASRLALKLHTPLVNVGAGDPTVTEHNVPWVIRCNPDDRQASYVLARHIFEERKLSRVAVLRSQDRYGRTGVTEFRDAARRLGRPLAIEMSFKRETSDFGSQLERVEASGVQAVVLWAKAAQAGIIVRQMRGRGMTQPVFGTDRMATPAFLAAAGPASEGATATYWMDPERKDPAWLAFKKRFAARFGKHPEAFAAYGFDAANLLLAAIRRAGLNRVRIRDELYAARSYSGVTGPWSFDITANNVSRPVLARVENGRFVFH